MKPHRAFSKQNVYGFWVGCIEYPCGAVSVVTNAKYTEGAALDIAQRMIEGADGGSGLIGDCDGKGKVGLCEL